MADKCQKVTYESRNDALTDIKFIRDQQRHFSKTASRMRKAARHLRPYPCKWCGRWHITTQKQYRIKNKS